MRKILISLFVVIASCSMVFAQGYPWKPQLGAQKVFRRDLSGTAPTEAECTANFVSAGDKVIDTSNDDEYLILNATGPVYTKISAAGASTVPSLTVSGNITSTGTGDGLTVKSIARATYSFAVDGGTTGTVISLDATIPDNAIVTDGYIDVTTALLPVTSTVALQLNTANDIYSASTNLAVGGVAIFATVPVGTAATSVKMTNDNAVGVLLNAAAVTQGVFTVVLEYDKLAL